MPAYTVIYHHADGAFARLGLVGIENNEVLVILRDLSYFPKQAGRLEGTILDHYTISLIGIAKTLACCPPYELICALQRQSRPGFLCGPMIIKRGGGIKEIAAEKLRNIETVLTFK